MRSTEPVAPTTSSLMAWGGGAWVEQARCYDTLSSAPCSVIDGQSAVPITSVFPTLAVVGEISRIVLSNVHLNLWPALCSPWNSPLLVPLSLSLHQPCKVVCHWQSPWASWRLPPSLIVRKQWGSCLTTLLRLLEQRI